MSIRVGISGWRYVPWRGDFYPRGLPQRAELAYAASLFPTIEINGSFYSLQRPASYAAWAEQTPAGFVFAVKAPRYITHMLRLRGVEQALANFFASGVLILKGKLGPLLWQFPPNFRYEQQRMEEFLRRLPRDTAAALSLARKRSAWMKGRTSLTIDRSRRLRHAFEVRHESFLNPSWIALLRKYRVAQVIADAANRWPLREDVTADFLYIRLHGDKELYRSGYSDAALARWARRIAVWHRGQEPPDAQRISATRLPARRSRDVFCFFDNTDDKLRAPVDAQALIDRLGA
jgi:uncharacterized protein YecE (DUF72 family)